MGRNNRILSFCPCHVRGQEQWQGPGGEMIQSEIFTCSLQPWLHSFQSMLMPVHLQSGTVSCNTHTNTHTAPFFALCDGQFRLLCDRTSISVIILIITIILWNIHFTVQLFFGARSSHSGKYVCNFIQDSIYTSKTLNHPVQEENKRESQGKK